MRLLLTGASGQLGSYVLRECLRRGETVVAWSGQRQGDLFGCPLHPIDLAEPDAIAFAFRTTCPERVLHTAAMSAVSDCYRDPQRAERINTRGSAVLAELADRAKVPLVHISTDMVFDGEHAPYREEDAPAPLSVYGRTKAEAERAVLAYPRNTVVRLPLLFGPTLAPTLPSPKLGEGRVGARLSFFDQQVLALRRTAFLGRPDGLGRPSYESRRITLFLDEWRTPLSLLVAARVLVDLAASGPLGLLQVGGPERLSRFEMGQRLAVFLGCDPDVIESVSRTSIPSAEPRPADLSLDSSRWRSLFPHQQWPTWYDALDELMSPTS